MSAGEPPASEVLVVVEHPVLAEAMVVALGTRGVQAQFVCALEPPDLAAAIERIGPAVVMVGIIDRELRSMVFALVRGMTPAVVTLDQPTGSTPSLGSVVEAVARLLPPSAPGRGSEARLLSALTRREAEILTALVRGQTVPEVAESEGLAVTTVRSHVRSILHKLGVRSQLAAVALVHRSSWLEL